MKMICVERKTGVEFLTERVTLSNGKEGWTVFNKAGEKIKDIAESTFKRNYKLTDKTEAKEEISEEITPDIKKVNKKDTTIKVWLMTFTGMIIGADPYEATFNGKEYIVNTHKKGVQKFDKEGKQIGAKNPKFANKIQKVEDAAK